jgi:hypothetical protein
MAASGKSFCSSAWNGFLLNLKHMLEFAWANLLAKMFILIGKIAIVVGNCFLFVLVITKITKESATISIMGPVAVVAMVTFFTASVFLALFDTAVLSLMTCRAIDYDLHNGEPVFGPPTYHDKIESV